MQVARSSGEFMDASSDDLAQMILSDELNVKNESTLFEIIINWIDYNPAERLKVFKL